MPHAAVEIKCQRNQRQGNCICGSAIDFLLSDNVAAYWIKKPVTAHGEMLDALGLQTSQLINSLGISSGWIVHYATFQKPLIQEIFESAQEAFAAGLKWLEENEKKVDLNLANLKD